MAHTRLALVAVAALLPVAANPVVRAAPGASSHRATTLSVEQVGPKFLLSAWSPHTRISASVTIPIRITSKELEVEELGPKYLLGS